MKKVLRITGIILLSMLIGYGVGRGLSHILGGGGDGESTDKIKMAKAVLKPSYIYATWGSSYGT